MEMIDRYLLTVTCALAIVISSILGIVSGFVSSPREALVVAGVPYTPVVLGLKFELRRGRLTVSLLAQLREDDSGHSLPHDLAKRSALDHEPALYSALRRIEPHEARISESNGTRNRKTNSPSLDGAQIVRRLFEEAARLQRID